MVQVKPREGESIDSLLNRFKKKVNDNGILADYRKKEFFEKPSVMKKKKHEAAIKKQKKLAKKKWPKASKAVWQWNHNRTKKIDMTNRKPQSKPVYQGKGKPKPKGKPNKVTQSQINKVMEKFNRER